MKKFTKMLTKYNIILKSMYHNLNNSKSTIFALSSGFGKCGVAVIRISGPATSDVLTRMAGFKELPEPRKVFLRKIRNPSDKNILDKGLIVWFESPKSFTGEDCCELQIHGGKAVISAVLKALSGLNNFRPALPGEFTKRAFYAGKLDLTEIEGLADLIESETEAQRKQALNQMNGALSRIYNSWRQSLTKVVAQIEAYIDFSESENIEDNLIADAKPEIKKILQTIQKHVIDGRRGERLRDGVQAVILGAPNVGKSSLLNLLCRKEEAIVSPIAGTTRDIVSSTLDIGGYPLVIKDTAGLRKQRKLYKSFTDKDETTDEIEIEGISRALDAARKSDLILLVIDPSHLDSNNSLEESIIKYCEKLGILEFISECDNNFLRTNKLNGINSEKTKRKCLLILNKLDLIANGENIKTYFNIAISCKMENGINKMLETLTTNLELLCGRGDVMDATCNQIRHIHCLNEVMSSLELSLNTLEPDILAHNLRQALYSLGKITGHVSTEQILDVIFKNFCVGK